LGLSVLIVLAWHLILNKGKDMSKTALAMDLFPFDHLANIGNGTVCKPTRRGVMLSQLLVIVCVAFAYWIDKNNTPIVSVSLKPKSVVPVARMSFKLTVRAMTPNQESCPTISRVLQENTLLITFKLLGLGASGGSMAGQCTYEGTVDKQTDTANFQKQSLVFTFPWHFQLIEVQLEHRPVNAPDKVVISSQMIRPTQASQILQGTSHLQWGVIPSLYQDFTGTTLIQRQGYAFNLLQKTSSVVTVAAGVPTGSIGDVSVAIALQPESFSLSTTVSQAFSSLSIVLFTASAFVSLFMLWKFGLNFFLKLSDVSFSCVSFPTIFKRHAESREDSLEIPTIMKVDRLSSKAESDSYDLSSIDVSHLDVDVEQQPSKSLESKSDAADIPLEQEWGQTF